MGTGNEQGVERTHLVIYTTEEEAIITGTLNGTESHWVLRAYIEAVKAHVEQAGVEPYTRLVIEDLIAEGRKQLDDLSEILYGRWKE